MEEILGQVMTPPINLKDFLLNYQKVFKNPYKLPLSDVNIQNVMGLSFDNNRYNAIEETCSLDNLKQHDDPRIAEFIPGYSEIPRKPNIGVPLEGQNLKSYKTLVKSKETKRASLFQRSRDNFSMLKAVPVEDDSPINILPGEEIKLYVRIYRPTRATHVGRTLERPVFSQEFECLGHNLLTELRDKIQCVCNNKRFFDISENPEEPLPTKESDPGYFFITDTFYNDKRNKRNADYSATIRNWAKKAKGLSSLKFKTALMETTQFLDLTISLGFPQLYQHHGNCEHVFVFSQVEVITNPCTQLLPLASYPQILTISRYNTRSCNICGKVNFVFVVIGSNRQLHDPAYLCKQCFTSLHYVDGKKIGQFRAYRLNDEQQSLDDNLDETMNTNDDLQFPEENLNETINTNEENNDNSDEEVNIVVKEETKCN